MKANIDKIFAINVTAVLFTIAKRWKQARCLLMDEWMNKIWYIVYIYKGNVYIYTTEY